jgi:alkaline phosphatase D
MQRRQFLAVSAAGAGGLALTTLAGCTPAPGPEPADGPFDCGVASGVHSADAVVLWTRFAPAALDAVELSWTVATDAAFTTVVASGVVTASPAGDGTAKVLAEGLAPATTYWYRFAVDGSTSAPGRTRTLPHPDSTPERVRFAVGSCQQFAAGFYPAWRAIAEADVDAVLHLGDYIYESTGNNPFAVRTDPIGTASDLAGYRAKYRLVRSDRDLQAAHAAHPFAPIWDDHELVNDVNLTIALTDPDRQRDAYQAWFEYQPVWPIDGNRIHRRARYGRLVDVSLLDGRQHRDPQPTDQWGEELVIASTATAPGNVVHSPERSLLGAAQYDWLTQGLSGAQDDGVTWKLIGNPVMMHPVRLIDLDEPWLRQLDPAIPRHAGLYLFFDMWDGYQDERQRLLQHLHDDQVRNVAVATGDIHSFWQGGLRVDIEDERSPVVAQEYVCGSISSRAADYLGDLAQNISQLLQASRPPLNHVDFSHRGYGIMEYTPAGSRVSFHRVDASVRVAAPRPGPAFSVDAATGVLTNL